MEFCDEAKSESWHRKSSYFDTVGEHSPSKVPEDMSDVLKI